MKFQAFELIVVLQVSASVDGRPVFVCLLDCRSYNGSKRFVCQISSPGKKKKFQSQANWKSDAELFLLGTAPLLKRGDNCP